ncbi:MAG: hypothetical protein ABW123_21605 [Cystobacter sp.]
MRSFRPRLRVWLPLLVGAALFSLGLFLEPLLRGASLVARASGRDEGLAGHLARWDVRSFTVEDTAVPSRTGPLRGRVFRPARPLGRTVLLIPGVHAEGIDEPRLGALAGELSRGGLTVITLELPDLLRYALTPREPDQIEDAVLWASARPEFAPDGRVGLMGISFSGGLSLVAAGRPSLADKVAFTFSLGGHGDLSRVLSFLCTGLEEDGRRRAPHDYGVVILLLNVAGRLVPQAQVEGLREGILTFLRASHLAMHDAPRAARAFAEARRQQAALPEPAATLLGYVNARDVAALGPLLLPHVTDFASAAALSPERSPAPPSPVFLLHGLEDTVIPARESTRLARALESRTRVHLLLTPLITHAEMDRGAGTPDVWRLADFWATLLDT